MFKNAILYRIALPSSAALINDLQQHSFTPTSPSQDLSSGWIPPREKHGLLVETIDGQHIIKLMIETRSVPASALQARLDDAVACIESSTGRKPGKKETRDLKEELRLELLPKAFPKQVTVLGWIDPKAGTLLVDASSQAQSDLFITALVRSVEGLQARPLQTVDAPAAAMSEWLLSQQPPAGFSVDRECELKACDDSKAVVRYACHALDIDEVQQHITGGKRPTKLALTWAGSCSFVLTETMALKKITLLDGKKVESGADDFDANTVIATGILRQTIAALIEALGGEQPVEK